MATGTLTIVGSIGCVTIQKTISKTADHPNVYGDASSDIALAAGKDATGWVKTDANTAACNLAANHGYTNAQCDVYWNSAAAIRYDVAMVVTVNALALEGGSGDDFPDNATAGVVVCKHQQINTAIDGDAVELLVIDSTTKAHLHFEDSGAAVVADLNVTANQPTSWYANSGIANPLTGNAITACYASCGQNTAGVLTILSLEDSTP